MGLSFAEIGMVLLVALIVIGPEKLPKVAKSIGKGYAEFKRAFNDLKRAADINNVEVSPSRTKEVKSTYKSRWEAEALETNGESENKATVGTSAVNTMENKAEDKIEDKIEDKAEVRAKRSDLIKEAD
jgi:TatA/E family protein of Tat protein translocase